MSKAAELKVNILRFNEGITLEMLALETLYGNQFTSLVISYYLLLSQLIISNYHVITFSRDSDSSHKIG